jgi:hypothetical protein
MEIKECEWCGEEFKTKNKNAKNCCKSHAAKSGNKKVKEKKDYYIIDDLKNESKKKRGDCLSVKYNNTKTKYKWICSEGHIWEARWNDIRRGHWCPKCAFIKNAIGNRVHTINDLQEFAIKKDGKCLSEKYISMGTKYKWKCQCGYVWGARWENIKRGEWCPKCANRLLLTIEEMKKLAEYRCGLCLSDKYINNSTKLEWQCLEGHTWEATPGSVKSGKWCRKCAYRKNGEKKRGYIIEDLQQFAQGKNGECLSIKYINNKTKYIWKCEFGHQWKIAWTPIQNGHWCPTCYTNNFYKSEACCKEIIELIFNKKFNKIVPIGWGRLEIDIYNEELKLGFEHNGLQHYEFSPWFHRTEQGFIDQQERDERKKRLCIENGITLISIPHIKNILNLKIADYLKNELDKNNVKYKDFNDKDLEFIVKKYY